MIDLANGSHSGLGLYASSRSYQAGSGPDFRLEMDGLQFSDIPLLAGSNPALLQQAAAQFKMTTLWFACMPWVPMLGCWQITSRRCARLVVSN